MEARLELQRNQKKTQGSENTRGKYEAMRR